MREVLDPNVKMADIKDTAAKPDNYSVSDILNYKSNVFGGNKSGIIDVNREVNEEILYTEEELRELKEKEEELRKRMAEIDRKKREE